MLNKIKFVQEIPKLYTGKYINYYDYKLDEINAQFHSLQQIIKENQDEWLLDYDAWHTQLYNLLLHKSKYYSFSGISRSTIWYPIDLDKLFFSLALLKFNQNNDEPVLVINAPSEINKLIDPQISINYFSQLYKVISFLSFIFRLAKLILKLFFNFKIYKTKINIDNIVFSYDLNTRNDHFFNDIFNNENLKFRYLYHTENTFLKKEKNSKSILYIYHFIYIKDIFFVVIESIKLYIKSLIIDIKVPLKFSNININDEYFKNALLKKTIISNTPLIEFVTYKCFINIITENNIKKIIYPFEDKGVEHSILLALKNSNKQINTIGFAHANYNNGHRYINYKNHNVNEYPNILATTGQTQNIWLNEICNWPIEKLLIIGSPKYKKIEPKIKNENKKSIIFLVGYLHELIQFSNFLKETKISFINFNIHIRLYPHADLKEQMIIIKNISNSNINVYVDNDLSLKENLLNIDYAIFSSSTAGFEAIMNNCYTMYIPMNLNIITNPLKNKKGSECIPTINNSSEFMEHLKYLSSMNNDTLLTLKEQQIYFVNNIFSPFVINKIL